MNFTNMSAAERMKASALIGLIVIVMFFVVHTVLGAISSRKVAAAPAGSTDAAAAGQIAPPAPPAPAAPENAVPPSNAAAQGSGGVNMTDAFPSDRLNKIGMAGSGGLGMDIHDPFLPIHDKKEKTDVRPSRMMKSSSAPPSIDMTPAGNHQSLPPLISGGYNQTGSSPSSSGMAMPMTIGTPVAVQPEIRLVGLVDGSPSVATIQVNGRMLLARPGDVLSKGWRLLEINPEGIILRHAYENIELRVGNLLNEVKAGN